MPSYTDKAFKRAGSSLAPSREGRVHIGAYLPYDFRTAVRLLQAVTGEDLQTILARALNEQFRQNNLPEVDQTGLSTRNKPARERVVAR